MSEQIKTVADPKLRILEIESELAEMKRRYLVEGIEGDIRKRATLEAEAAALSIQRHIGRIEAFDRKVAAKDVKAKSFQAILCKKVEDAGLAHLIKEAQNESLQHIKDAGLYADYSIQGDAA